MTLSTHVLDLASGRPAANIPVIVEQRNGGSWHPLATTDTDTNGRCADLLPSAYELAMGTVLRLRFETGAHFAAQQIPSLYPYIEIVFTLQDDRHHHIPLLLAANGYTTYRGS